MIGEVGVARTALEPEGQVLVHGEYWDAVAASNIPAGAQVRVKGMAGLKLQVEPADLRTHAARRSQGRVTRTLSVIAG